MSDRNVFGYLWRMIVGSRGRRRSWVQILWYSEEGPEGGQGLDRLLLNRNLVCGRDQPVRGHRALALHLHQTTLLSHISTSKEGEKSGFAGCRARL